MGTRRAAMRILERLVGRHRDSSAFEKWKSLGDAEAIVARELAAWRETQAGPPPYRLLDIGGGDGAQLDGFLTPMGDAFSCESLDIDGPEEPGRIVFDICKPVPARWHDRYDVVHSHNALEHFAEPWVAADNVAALLKPGGLCLVRSVFAWRYHPVPRDFYRFSDDGLLHLFSERNNLKVRACGYDIGRRRENIEGGHFGDRDIPPLDGLGGFRENWSVYYVGVKP